MLCQRCPAWRWREPSLGFSTELWEPVVLMLRENLSGRNHESETPMQGTGAERPVVVMKRL
jgi:hypothetical protein